ncbi:MAG: EthD domain-containing protein [Deltaproteobacteria bacterium]|nr:EthD domain-containing protein [Deltaproteobacteria bacterium]
MIKLIFFCRRHAEITHERYAELLLSRHVPRVLRHHSRLRKYVVNLVELSPPGEAVLDSIDELSFDSRDDFREYLYDSLPAEAPEAGRLIAATHAYATTEHVHKAKLAETTLGERSPGVKLICPVMRRADMSHAEFAGHWLNRHVPLALRHHPALSCYITNVVDEQLSPTGEAWDGIAELHFAKPEDLWQGFFDSQAGEQIIRQDIERFIGRGGAYRVAEYVEKRPA